MFSDRVLQRFKLFERIERLEQFPLAKPMSLFQQPASGRVLLSVVTPAYNEADNLPLFYERLSTAFKSSGVEWEWIVIDDHSSDETFSTIAKIARPRPKGSRHSSR